MPCKCMFACIACMHECRRAGRWAARWAGRQAGSAWQGRHGAAQQKAGGRAGGRVSSLLTVTHTYTLPLTHWHTSSLVSRARTCGWGSHAFVLENACVFARAHACIRFRCMCCDVHALCACVCCVRGYLCASVEVCMSECECVCVRALQRKGRAGNRLYQTYHRAVAKGGARACSSCHNLVLPPGLACCSRLRACLVSCWSKHVH